MDLRIGVIQYTLLNGKLRNKGVLAAEMTKVGENTEVFAVHVH